MKENFEKSVIKYRVQHLGETRDQVVSEISVELGLLGTDWDFMWYIGGILYEKQEVLDIYEEACLKKIQENPNLFKNEEETGLLQTAKYLIETPDDIEVGVNWKKLEEPGRTNTITVVAWRRALQRYFSNKEGMKDYDSTIYNPHGEIVNIRNHPIWHEVLDGAFLECPIATERAGFEDVPLKNKPAVERWYANDGNLTMEEAWQQRVVVVLT